MEGADYNRLKKCSDCKTDQPYDQFYKNKTRKDGYQNCCKDCLSDRMSGWYLDNKELVMNRTDEYRKNNLEKYLYYTQKYRESNPEKTKQQYLKSRVAKYNLTVEQYEQMLESQNYLCAICFKPDPYRETLSVDHSHDTGVVRGLLCQPCNVALGFLEDDALRLCSAIVYLAGDRL